MPRDEILLWTAQQKKALEVLERLAPWYNGLIKEMRDDMLAQLNVIGQAMNGINEAVGKPDESR